LKIRLYLQQQIVIPAKAGIQICYWLACYRRFFTSISLFRAQSLRGYTKYNFVNFPRGWKKNCPSFSAFSVMSQLYYAEQFPVFFTRQGITLNFVT